MPRDSLRDPNAIRAETKRQTGRQFVQGYTDTEKPQQGRNLDLVRNRQQQYVNMKRAKGKNPLSSLMPQLVPGYNKLKGE